MSNPRHPAPTGPLTPTPPNYALTRLHQALADLELVTSAVEAGEAMPTPGDISRLFGFGQRLKARAQGAGFEVPTDTRSNS